MPSSQAQAFPANCANPFVDELHSPCYRRYSPCGPSTRRPRNHRQSRSSRRAEPPPKHPANRPSPPPPPSLLTSYRRHRRRRNRNRKRAPRSKPCPPLWLRRPHSRLLPAPFFSRGYPIHRFRSTMTVPSDIPCSSHQPCESRRFRYHMLRVEV